MLQFIKGLQIKIWKNNCRTFPKLKKELVSLEKIVNLMEDLKLILPGSAIF